MKTCLELKGFSSNRFDKIMASVPKQTYFCLFKHCLLSGGGCHQIKQMCLVPWNVHLLSPFESGSETKAKTNLFLSLSTFLILVRARYATLSCPISCILHTIFLIGFHSLNFQWMKGAGYFRHVKDLGKTPL